MDNLQNGSSSRQQLDLSPCLSLKDTEDFSLKEKKALLEGLDAVNLSIIKIIDKEGKLLARDLMDALHLSRAPILKRLRQLSEDGYLIRHAKAGTDKNSKPTYVYEVSPQLKASICPGKQDNHSKTTEEATIETEEETAIEIMAELLKAAVQEIADLKRRVSRLEATLKTKSKLDHKELLNKLKS